MMLKIKQWVRQIVYRLIRPFISMYFQESNAKNHQLLRIRKVVRRELTRNRRLQEQLKAKLETIGMETSLFGEALSFPKRTNLLTLCAQTAYKVNPHGLFLEFGVYQGKTLNHIAEQVPAHIFGFDSFEGIPSDWVQGSHHVTKQGKRTTQKQLPQLAKNAELVVGLFQDTLAHFLKTHSAPTSFVHIDSDLYESAAFVLDKLPFTEGSVIAFDEYYNYPSWQNGEYRAFQEFLEKYKWKATCLGYVAYSCQAAFRLSKT